MALTDDERKKYWDNIMNYDEMKKLWEEMMDADITNMSFSTSATPLPPLDDDMVDRIRRNYMGTPHVTQQLAKAVYPHHSRHQLYPGVSPTDVDARGLYEYQEPERDEQGTFYGYKILHRHRKSYDAYALVSPRYIREWVDGCLRADREPSERSMFGVHCTKRPDHPELGQYSNNRNSALVRCALSGTVVETEQGFRAEFAQIVGVYCYGNWRSYQDYSERAKANSYRSSRTEEEEYYWRAGHGTSHSYWDAFDNPYFDPNDPNP